jgi:hypothetical protein
MPDKSKIETELDFLESLEQGEVVTQMTLSKRVSVSIGLINALLRRAVQKGYVKAKAAPYKRYAYYLTPKGFAEKSLLVAKYLERSLHFFRSARQEYGDVFARAQASGMQRVALIGSGELVEIALMAARETDVAIVAVLDRETNKDRVCGVPVVRSLDELPGIDGVVITASRHPQAAFDLVRDRFGDSQILAPSLLRITRIALDFKPPKVASRGQRK